MIRVVQMACPLSLSFSLLLTSAFFVIVECANNTEVISHCTDKQPYWDLYIACSLRGEQLYDLISHISSKETFVLACVCA